MSLWTRLADRLVPPSALSSWTVPLRRVDSLKEKLAEAHVVSGLYVRVGRLTQGFPPLNAGLFNGSRVVLTELVDEGQAVRVGGRVVLNPLTWNGGLAPWPPNG